mgnify:FL=1|jgi:glutaredoxin 3|tara:strand:- start:471 stop:701 length:231 start_codon:yes stop_codon:yes gene_type:complete
MIVIYGKPRCGFCTSAKALCERLNLEYEYKLLDADYTAEELFELVPEAKTFPQVFINDKPIGGFNELKNLVQQGAG